MYVLVANFYPFSEVDRLCSVRDDPALPLAGGVRLDGGGRGTDVPLSSPSVRVPHLQIHVEVQPRRLGYVEICTDLVSSYNLTHAPFTFISFSY